jgi:hypothetical protein
MKKKIFVYFMIIIFMIIICLLFVVGALFVTSAIINSDLPDWWKWVLLK